MAKKKRSIKTTAKSGAPSQPSAGDAGARREAKKAPAGGGRFSPRRWLDVTATFLREVRVELKKVTWPTRKEALASTLVVLVLTFISALYLFGIDGILRFVIKVMTGKAA
jgi:preprotein translocase subunit SecE